MTIMLTDDELIDYCETHCKTERALFSGEQINRMVLLAGLWEHPDADKFDDAGWFPMRDDMQRMVDLARNAKRVAKEKENLQECVSWIPVAILPDADDTVQLFDATASEPVWPGYFDGERWLYVDGVPAAPTHYAPMLAGPVI